MSKRYDLEFKKEVVREYLKGKSLGDLFATKTKILKIQNSKSHLIRDQVLKID